MNEHANGHLFLRVDDGTGEIDIPIFVDKAIDHEILILDEIYLFIGRVNVFNNRLQIIPEDERDVMLIEN